jgi:hypothetical protein
MLLLHILVKYQLHVNSIVEAQFLHITYLWEIYLKRIQKYFLMILLLLLFDFFNLPIERMGNSNWHSRKMSMAYFEMPQS